MFIIIAFLRERLKIKKTQKSCQNAACEQKKTRARN